MAQEVRHTRRPDCKHPACDPLGDIRLALTWIAGILSRMTEEQSGAEKLLIRVPPRADTQNPSYWWSALRLVQASKAFEQLRSTEERILRKLQDINWPWARGIFDDPRHGVTDWEMPYDPTAVVSTDEKREASFLASEILHYIGSSLDHLVYNASWLDQGAPPQDDAQFPIVDRISEWSNIRTLRRLSGMSQQHIDWIEAVQPYNGTEWSKALQRLSNSDKHRFGVEVCPTVRFELDKDYIHPDPRDSNRQLIAIKTVSLQMLLPALGPDSDIYKTFGAMFLGAGDLVNKFLAEGGLSPIRIENIGR
jgi:hypothetical protein